MKLHQRIFLGMGIGLIFGLILLTCFDHQSDLFNTIIWWLNLFGKDTFIALLKMIIAPLIFSSIVAGITSLPNMKELGAIGVKVFGFYFITTTLAVAIGLAAVLYIKPGKKDASNKIREQRVTQLNTHRENYRRVINNQDPFAPEHLPGYLRYIASAEGTEITQSNLESKWQHIKAKKDLSAGDMFKKDILSPLMMNPFHALSQSPPNSLGIIFFAVLLGLACMAVGKSSEPVVQFFVALADVMMKVTLWVMEFAPIALGCIIASLVATLGVDALTSLGWYCITVVFGIGIHIIILLMIVSVFGKTSPLTFMKGIRTAWLIAFSTTSSAATLPVTLECVVDNLNISPKIANFNLPIGATMNMDGTALYEGVAIIFLIQIYGGLDDVPVVLTAGKTFVIFITAVLASIGAAAIPSAGLVTMAIVASAVGLPLYYIFLIYAVDHLLDMFRTSTNVLSDAACAVVINRFEGHRLE